jgi:hypothetical protein
VRAEEVLVGLAQGTPVVFFFTDDPYEAGDFFPFGLEGLAQFFWCVLPGSHADPLLCWVWTGIGHLRG